MWQNLSPPPVPREKLVFTALSWSSEESPLVSFGDVTGERNISARAAGLWLSPCDLIVVFQSLEGA